MISGLLMLCITNALNRHELCRVTKYIIENITRWQLFIYYHKVTLYFTCKDGK